MENRDWTQAEVDQYCRQKDQLFYFNQDDKNFLVPKTEGLDVPYILLILSVGLS